MSRNRLPNASISRREFSDGFKREAVQMLLDGHSPNSVCERYRAQLLRSMTSRVPYVQGTTQRWEETQRSPRELSSLCALPVSVLVLSRWRNMRLPIESRVVDSGASA